MCVDLNSNFASKACICADVSLQGQIMKFRSDILSIEFDAKEAVCFILTDSEEGLSVGNKHLSASIAVIL